MITAHGIIKSLTRKRMRMMIRSGLISRCTLLVAMVSLMVSLLASLTACSTLHKGAGLPAPITRSLAQLSIPHSAVALDIRTLEGQSLVSHNHQVAFQPASVLKLVTTAAALDILGPNYRWMTRVHTSGAIVGDVLEGHLIIEGGGDPRLAHEDLARLLRRLRALGIREIHGDLLLDRSLFQQTDENAASFDGLPHRAYNALPDA